MSERPVTVEVYEVPPPAPRREITHSRWQRFFDQRRRAPVRRWNAGVVAATGSLLLHVLLIGSVMWGGTPVHAHMPEKQGSGSTATVSDQEPTLTVVFIDQPGIKPSEETSPMDLASRGPPRDDFLVKIVSPDALPAVDLSQVSLTSTDQAPPPQSDGTQRAVLFGRYLGQINARIERAWLRPRSAIGAEEFHCLVRVTQDAHGRVHEIELRDCNGDPRWQTSLAQAIQSASPLPAAPDPAVFTDAVTLSFHAAAFGPGADPQNYEPELVARITNPAAGPSPAGDASRMDPAPPPPALRGALAPHASQDANPTDAALGSGDDRTANPALSASLPSPPSSAEDGGVAPSPDRDANPFIPTTAP